MFLSDNHLKNLTHMAAGAVGLRGHAERVAGEAIRTGALVLSTGGMAYANGRWSQPGTQCVEVGGVPVDLAGGIGLTALSLAGLFGRFGEITASVGGGMLSAYAARMGTQWGANAKIAAAAGTPAIAAPTATSGKFGVGSPPLYPAVDAPRENWAS